MKTVILLIVACLVLIAGTASASIINSAHDFSPLNWSGGKICLPCHTPHNANTTVADSPLWNHQLTSATFVMYNSPSITFQPEVEPQGTSKLCLSCHDGTIALDSFSNNTAGTNFISADFNIGADLSNDHPISTKWKHQTTLPDCSNCHFTPKLPFSKGFVECTTCHDVHNKAAFPNLLRLSMQGSELCLVCHGK